MTAVWIKICGNTRLEDCQRAVTLGADALGFIFSHGKRLVTAEHVRGITRHLPAGVATFGVFTQTDAEIILRTVDEAGISGVQLHGTFQPEVAKQLRSALPGGNGQPRILQVIHWYTDDAAATQVTRLRDEIARIADSGAADALLVDSRTRQASGGTGVAFDWAAAADALSGLSLPLIVAGGLRPENVALAIRTLQPWGVDVSSGVEQAPGVKDEARLEAFLRNARG